MATKHWVRDVLCTDPKNYCSGGNHLRANAILYHFLRNAGFDWLWECGNENANSLVDPNHVTDGNMENAGVSDWTATGSATLAKVTTPVRSGTQALEVDPTAGLGGVQSSVLTANSPLGQTTPNNSTLSAPDAQGIVTYYNVNSFFSADADEVGQEFEMIGSSISVNNGRFPIVGWVSNTTIEIYNPNGLAQGFTTVSTAAMNIRAIMMTSMYVSNNTTTLNVSVDRGDGTPIVVGTIPNNGGVSTKYNFSWSYQGSGTPSIYVENPIAGSAFYIDSINTWRSAWDYYMARDEKVASPDTSHYSFTNNLAVNHYGVDGALTNPDQFSTGAGDGYSPDGDDVGKHLFVWDSTNNTNSGVYEIIADLGGGSVQLDLRSGSAALTTTTGLNWRIVNIQQFQGATTGAGTFPNSPMADWIHTAGFGIESPHSTSWRFFMRQNQQGGSSNVRTSELWSAPEDTDFNQSTGHFWMTGPSVMRYRVGDWTRNVSGGGVNADMHTWRGTWRYTTTPLLTRTFIMTDEDLSFFTMVHWDGGYPTYTSHGCFLIGYHDSDADHPGIMSFVHLSRWEEVTVDNEIGWDDDTNRFAISGTSFNYQDFSVRCCAAQLGYGVAATGIHELSNAGVNPWSNEEWLQELRIVNDPDAEESCPSERDAGSNIGVYQGRHNMTPLATFDSNQYLHFDVGLVWEWSGESLVP